MANSNQEESSSLGDIHRMLDAATIFPSQAFLDKLQEVAKNPTGSPSKAFLDRLRHVQENPDETVRKFREDAIQSGRDPDAFAKMIAQVSKKTQSVQLTQRPQDGRTGVAVETAEVTVESMNAFMAEEGAIQFDTPSPAVVLQDTGTAPPRLSAGFQAGTGTQDGRRRTPPPVSALTKPTRRHHRNERDVSKNKVRKTTAKSRQLSGTYNSAPPTTFDSPQSLAESSSSGLIRGIPNAPSHSLEKYASPTQPVAQSYPFPTRTAWPEWYLSIPKQTLAQLDRKRPPQIRAMAALKECIGLCQQEKEPSTKLEKLLDKLRDHIHEAEFNPDMDQAKVRKTLILAQTGLPRIFDERATFPMDLKADAWHLYERWMNEDFDTDILRGTITVRGDNRSGDRLDAAYREKHPKDPKTFGDNGAMLGQWWPSQLCTVRDGIHGAAQGGIYGDKEKGAYSIVLSSGGYHDRDDGDAIEYSGTDGKDFEITAATQSMITSSRLGKPIRVLRSSQLPKNNKHRPVCGIRYDGLYEIKSYDPLDLEKQIYRFHLQRISGQEPIRSQGATKRPTHFEVKAYNRCKGRL